MPKPNITPYQTIVTLICLFASPLAASDTDQLSGTELKDKWGQILFCQKIYSMQEVMPRLYDFDREQCNAAARLAEDLVAKYPLNEQQALKVQAERHARALSLNATEPYQSVPACREYCSKVARIRDEREAKSSR